MKRYPLHERPHLPGAAGGSTPVSPHVEATFRGLVQSPLRAGLLRYLHKKRNEAFEIEALTQTFGRVRLDIENCVRELVRHGMALRLAGTPSRYAAKQPPDPDLAQLLSSYLSGGEGPSSEEQSPYFQRFREMIGRDEKMLLVFESIRMVSKTDISALVLGPTGSGKEVVARMVHELSARRQEKFQAVNCAALPDTLFESELFGYEKGAFTGAHDRKPGRIELANHGTLFLDEIGDLSLVAQAKILRVVEEHRVERLGGHQSTDVDFRLICATNRPLDLFVSENRFREDLFYRINAFTIRLPALKERSVDIPVLADRFLAAYCQAQCLPIDAKVFSPKAHELLQAYPWPGNIRELESTVSRAALSASGHAIAPADVQFLHAYQPNRQPEEAGVQTLREVEGAHIRKVLDVVGWNKKKAARLLQIGRETLYRKIAEYQLRPPGRAPRGTGHRPHRPRPAGSRRTSMPTAADETADSLVRCRGRYPGPASPPGA